jgi:hypothetical protein
MNFDELLTGILPEPHTIIIEALDGSGGYGDVHGPPTEVYPCYAYGEVKNIRAADGSVTISSMTIMTPTGTACPPRSIVRLPDGTSTIAVTTSDIDDCGLGLPTYTEITCE